MDPVISMIAKQIAAAREGYPQVQSFFDEPTFTATYVVHDLETLQAAVIDSVLDYDPASGRTALDSANGIIAYVEQQRLKVT